METVAAPIGEKVARAEWVGLVAILHEVERLDPRRHVTAGAAAVDVEVIQPLVARVSPICTLLQLLEASTEISEPEVASLCFVARTEVKGAAKELEIPNRTLQERLVSSDVLRARMIHAIDAVLAAADGLPADAFERADGRAASRVRALYVRLRDVLDHASKRAARDTTHAIATVAVAMHAMQQHHDFQEVRLSDRFIIESLYRRMLAWGHSEVAAEDGGRLLLDAVAMSDLLAAINRRPSLRLHDFEAVESALVSLAREETDTLLVDRVERLHGRDSELDAFIVRLRNGPSNPTLRRLLTNRLRHLRDVLAPAPPPPQNSLDIISESL